MKKLFILYTLSGDDVAHPDHFAPVIGDYTPQICWNFTHGDTNQHEFYSPGYPQNYPNSTQCIGLLVGKFIIEFFIIIYEVLALTLACCKRSRKSE